jgi:hypothetical protein
VALNDAVESTPIVVTPPWTEEELLPCTSPIFASVAALAWSDLTSCRIFCSKYPLFGWEKGERAQVVAKSSSAARTRRALGLIRPLTDWASSDD